MRGLALLLVFAYHVVLFTGFEAAGPVGRAVVTVARHGWLGVDLFFVLSGFLITGILLDTRRKEGWLGRFYLRRLFRIVPAYYACLLVLSLTLAATGQGELVRPTWTASWFTNLLLAHEGWEALATPLHHFWSLAVEEQFYLAWPLLIAFLPRRGVAWLSIGLVALSAFFRVRYALVGEVVTAYVLLPARMDGLAVGALLAVLARREGGLAHAARVARLPGFAAGLVLLLIAVRGGGLGQGNPYTLAFGMGAMAVLAGAVQVQAAAGGAESRLRRFFDAPLLAVPGRYSYAMYLWHQPLVLLVVHLGRSRLGLVPGSGAELAVVIAGAGLATAAFTALSWRLVEAPALGLRDRLVAGSPPRDRLAAGDSEFSAPPAP